MKINNKNFPFTLFLVLFALIYIFLAVRPLDKALQLIPQWTIDITEPHIELPATEKLLPFKLGNNMGYYTPDGIIAFLYPIEQKGAISASYWSEFPSNARKTPFFDMRGTQSGIVENAGFPFFDDDRIYLHHPSGNSFSAHNADGSQKWAYEDYAPIMTFSSTASGSIAGFADGKLVALDPNGIVLQSFYPGGSRYQMIFGAALSENGEYTASLSGLDKQRIVISQIGGNQNKIIFHKYLENDVLEPTLVQFSSNNQYAFFNTKDELIIVNILKKSLVRVPIDGKILTITEIDADNTFFTLSKSKDTYTVSMFTNGNYKVGAFSFIGTSAFLYSDNNDIYIGYDMRISKITVSR